MGTEGKRNKKREHLDILRGGARIGLSAAQRIRGLVYLCLLYIANSVIGNYVQYVNNRIQSIQGHKTTILVTE